MCVCVCVCVCGCAVNGGLIERLEKSQEGVRLTLSKVGFRASAWLPNYLKQPVSNLLAAGVS